MQIDNEPIVNINTHESPGSAGDSSIGVPLAEITASSSLGVPLAGSPGSPLSSSEAARLEECERIIFRGMTAFLEVGDALVEIHDGRLYRRTHKTFDGYCRERLGMGKSRAHQLIDAAKVVLNLSTVVDIPPPSNERQIRFLAGLRPDKQCEVWEEANARTGGHPTAKVVRQVADEMRPKPERSPQPVAPPAQPPVWVNAHKFTLWRSDQPGPVSTLEQFFADKEAGKAFTGPDGKGYFMPPYPPQNLEIKIGPPPIDLSITTEQPINPDSENDMQIDPGQRVIIELRKIWETLKGLGPIVKSAGGLTAVAERLDDNDWDNMLFLGEKLQKSGEAILNIKRRP